MLLPDRSEEHTSELQSRVDISYAVFCLKKKFPRCTMHSQKVIPRVCSIWRSKTPIWRCGIDSGYGQSVFSFLFNHAATTEIYTLSLHDALPISSVAAPVLDHTGHPVAAIALTFPARDRSEEHTSELQSRVDISYAVFSLKK